MSVVDTRLLGRTFGGAEAEWPDWAFSMRAYGAAIDAAFPGAMEVASRATAPVLVTTLGGPEQDVARQLFFMLAMMTKGPATAPEPMEVGEIGGKRPHKGKAKAKGNRNKSNISKQQRLQRSPVPQLR